MELKISGVIATVFAGIVMGNYGRTKISQKLKNIWKNSDDSLGLFPTRWYLSLSV